MKLLKLKIVTPEKKVFEEDEIESVTFPTTLGEITILPNHIPIVSQLVLGEIVTRKKGKETSLMTTEGFLKVDASGSIKVLADFAIRSEDIEIAKVLEAKKKAEASMRDKQSQRDFAIAEAELRKTLLELKVSQKRRDRSTHKI